MFVASLNQYTEACQQLLEGDEKIYVDTETNGLDWRTRQVCGYAIRHRDRSYYFPFRHGEGPNLPLNLLSELHNKIVNRPDRLQVWHHYSYDGKVLAMGDKLAPPKIGAVRDTILAALVCNENEESFKLESLGKRYCSSDSGDPEEKLVDELVYRYGGARKSAKGNLWRLPGHLVAPYAEQDVTLAQSLDEFYDPFLDSMNLRGAYEELCEYQQVINAVELTGIQLDMPLMKQLASEAWTRTEEKLIEIEKLAGYPLNPNSPKQVCAWLRIPSSASAVLAQLDDPRATLVSQARKWAKINSTYYTPYAAMADQTGVLRGNLHITTPGSKSRSADEVTRNGTVAGRLSASQPNLTAIPRDEVFGIKRIFRARPGKLIGELDYSQAELRIAAHFSQDETLIRILLSGADLHGIVSRELSVSRQIAKAVNFSIWYGIGAETFAATYHVTVEQAREYLAGVHSLIPGIRKLSRACARLVARDGLIRMPHGRIRRYNHPSAKDFTAPNNLIQGTVGGIVQLAMIRIHKEVPEASQLLQVHDSICIEAERLETFEKCRAIMQDVPWCSMPMLVDMKIGKTLGDAKAVPRSYDGIPLAVLAMLPVVENN